MVDSSLTDSPVCYDTWHCFDLTTNVTTGGDGHQQAAHSKPGAAFGFDYSQLPLEPPAAAAGSSVEAQGGDAAAYPATSAAAGGPVPEGQFAAVPAAYRPPFATIPWQLSTNLPHDHLTHQVCERECERELKKQCGRE